jgi:uncharacterized protein (DUF1330 family)
MKPIYGALLAGVIGAFLGGSAVQILHAQTKPPGYLIAEVEVTDPATYKIYADGTDPIAAKYGAKFIVRGGKSISLAGVAPNRVAISIFESFEKAAAFQNDPDYKALVPIRDKSSKYRSYAVEGVN